MNNNKLNTGLALREKMETTFQNATADMNQKFSNKQELFKGSRRTYDTREGFADDDSKRGFTKVASTVNEQLDWYTETISEYLKYMFSIERTNASGIAKAELIVDGQSWGELYSTELLRLKGFLENPTLRKMFSEIPVRDERQVWTLSEDPLYAGKNIFETGIQSGQARTTLKESYILTDPHADKGNRPPQVAEKSTIVPIGDYTVQTFSGEASMRERAEMLRRLDLLHKGVVEALEKANDVQIVESSLGSNILDYIISGR